MLLFQAAVLCTLLTAAAAIAAASSPVVCPGTQESEQTSINSVQKFTNLREKLSGCQYIIGDVHLMRIDQRHFGPSDPELNFDFLSSIREVTGCVKVVESCFSNALEFPNLQVIRGTNCGNSSLVLQFDPECPLKTPHVAFPSLRLIIGSAVVYHVNSCYIERHIRFNDLSYNTAVSSVTRVGNCTELQDKCHENCTIWPEDGRRHCWGPELRHCQQRSHCRKLGSADCSHQLCFADSQGAERCCSDQCLGGCFGPSPSQCFGCKKFDRNGTCVVSCDPGHYYDPGSAQMVKVDTDVMVPYGPVCVAKCPDSYFTEDGNCVRKCTTGHKPNADRVCVPAETARLCELDQKMPSIVCDLRNPLLEGLTNESRLCTEYDGSLTISDDCLLHPRIPNARQITLNHLYIMFSKLKVFRGDLQVQLLNNASITNLSFFSRMERLETRPGQFNSGTMLVLAPYLQFLGLSSLRFIEKSIIFFLRAPVVPEGANVSFCTGFIPKPEAFKERIIDYGASGKGEDLKPVVRVAQRVKDALETGIYKHTCPYQPDTCDPQCEPRFGCWGPGPENCVRCRSVRTGSRCAESCESVSGWFDARNATSGDAMSAGSDRLCSPCHSLCSKCYGPGRGNCSACQKGAFQDGSHCAAECSRERQFADTTAGVCRPCPSVCVNLANGNATCTGNMTSVGPGGCQFCTRVMVVPHSNSDPTPVLECVPTESGCPQGYYAAVLERGGKHLANFTDFLALQQRVGFPVSVCRKCAPHCLSCSGSDFFCTTCRFYSVDTGTPGDAKCETRDSPKCRDGFYPDHETRTCRRCNSTCSSCSGPGEHDCLRCIASMYALLVDADVGVENENLTSTATLSCVDACPQDRPHAVASQRGLMCSSSPHGLRASDSDATVVPLTAILLSLAGLAAAFATVILSAWCCLRRRRLSKLPAEEEKEELEPILNRGYLTTISENELLRGPEVGSGAFGTVYKGEWMPADSDGRRTTVAIKILADSGDHSMSSELLEESRIMASVDHPHCVRLVGICMTQPLQLVTQFMPLGNLRDYLRCRREPGQIGGAQLLRYAAQIASGMGYLERLNIIHRDLACRNVLVSSSRCVRITDFGLAKALDNASQEYQATGGKLPVKWLALESLVSRRFTHKSDVWSYGVTLWEIFTFGEPPYPNVKPQDLADYLEKGERLPQPAVCMLDVYMLMIKCWMLDDHHRPTFDELEANFTRMCGQPERYVFTRAAARNPSHCSGASNNGWGGTGGVAAGSGSKSPRHSNNNRRSHSQDELDDAYVAMDALGGAGSEADEVFDDSPVDQAVALTAPPLPLPGHQLTLPHHPPAPVASVSKQRSFSVAAGGRRRATGPPPPLNNSQNQYTMDPCQPGPSDDYLQPMRPPVRLFDNPLPLPPRRSPPSAPLPPSPLPPALPPPLPPPPLRSPNRPVFANPEYFFQHSGGRASFSGGDFQPTGGGEIATAYGGGHTPNPASSNDSGIASPKFAFTKV